ncbi:ABC transporter ATP-binding protein [Treponema pedis]|uniref:ABC transporter ATP-binding protein n=1 Tax=Treponema pedis TaxID=409322 RepID=UPI0003F4C8A9|nr:ABC transporter ATP-binding protein [Treponema pedis]
MISALSAKNIYLRYDKKEIIKNFSSSFEAGKIISIIGPNGSGKSTLLRSFARLLKTANGKISLFDTDIASLSKKEFACRLSILLQYNIAPEDVTVKRLVLFGRAPHKKWYEPLKKDDEKILNEVLTQTRLTELTDKKVCELSGGERQRVWLAMALAQQPKVLLLDEPTTYLDIGYQFELLELIYGLNKAINLSIIMVLHDLNQAAQYSDSVLVLKDGLLFKKGTPKEIFTENLIKEIYDINCKIIYDEEMGFPIILPKRKSA